MNDIIQELNIENMIYEIRGKQVMLDSDLAKLYNVETKRINEAVKRNLDKFPERFSWLLTDEEVKDLWSQFATANISNMSRAIPRVFTEQGVAMLATILKSKTATLVSIQIMDAFVAMRKYIYSNSIEQKYINNLVMKHEERINTIFDYFDEKYPINEIYLPGQIYDAYSKILDIIHLAKVDLIIIDSYADKYVLDMISKIKVSVTIVLSTNSRLSELDIDKYNKEYNNLTLIYNDSFHDRFIILDKKKMYHLGTSLNNAGTKTFSINKVEDTRWLKLVLDQIEISDNNE
jgi:hypothetical protein